ncbi:MAG: hypothetical protein QOD06_892 [Candidatus Binatota bacterium]|nr:hypothetical protein [Candidatus Binatota bacterium]
MRAPESRDGLPTPDTRLQSRSRDIAGPVLARCMVAAAALLLSLGGDAGATDRMQEPPPTVVDRLPVEPPAPEGSAPALSAAAGVIFTSEYVDQGLLVEDQGAMARPFAQLGVQVHEDVMLVAGGLASFHDEHTDAATTDGPGERAERRAFYQVDWQAGLSLSVWRFGVTPLHVDSRSPSHAFARRTTLDVLTSFDDHDLFGGRFALYPSADFSIETRGKSGTGESKGFYVQPGIKPSYLCYRRQPLSLELSLPISTGLGFDDFYAGDERHGFSSVGVTALAAIDGGYLPALEWQIAPGVAWVHLNRDAQSSDVRAERVVFGMTLAASF